MVNTVYFLLAYIDRTFIVNIRENVPINELVEEDMHERIKPIMKIKF